MMLRATDSEAERGRGGEEEGEEVEERNKRERQLRCA